MKADKSSMLLAFVVFCTVVALGNILFWGLTTFVVFSMLQWMGVL